MTSFKIPIVLLMGPTAVGKSEIALELAEISNGEIINADSMLVYRGLDIGTAKPSLEDMRRIPHHLIDILDINEPFNVYRFRDLAENAICEIHKRGKTPIVTGGTGLYMRALIYGLDTLPSDRELNRELELKYAGNLDALIKLMEEKIPEDLRKFHPNTRKMLRALEVFLITGKSLSELQTKWTATPRENLVSYALFRKKEDLRRRIEDRTDQMLKEGWIEETRKILGKGLMETPTARQALGYGIIAEHLEGKITIREARDKIAAATWKLARRQETWFRNKHPEAHQVFLPDQKDEIFRLAGIFHGTNVSRRSLLTKANAP